MRSLKNLRHEAFAHKVAASLVSAEAGSKTPKEIYSELYGTTGHSAQSAATALMSKGAVLNRIRYLLLKSLPPERLSKSMKSLLLAQQTVWHRGKIAGKVPDHAVRLETAKTLLKIHGAFSDAPTVDIDARQINFHLSPEQAERLRTVAAELHSVNAAVFPGPPASVSALDDSGSGGGGVGGAS